MPFKVENFQDNVALWTGDRVQSELGLACEAYAALTTPQQKVGCIHRMMEVLDREVDEQTRQAIMEACGRQCIGATTLQKAVRLKKEAQNLDDLLDWLNATHIGGGRLLREGEVIHAGYDRCYCGSVSQSREIFSATYCHCSCGWYRQLFETLFERPVEVELLGSILQGDDRCEFLIRIPNK